MKQAFNSLWRILLIETFLILSPTKMFYVSITYSYSSLHIWLPYLPNFYTITSSGQTEFQGRVRQSTVEVKCFFELFQSLEVVEVSIVLHSLSCLINCRRQVASRSKHWIRKWFWLWEVGGSKSSIDNKYWVQLLIHVQTVGSGSYLSKVPFIFCSHSFSLKNAHT